MCLLRAISIVAAIVLLSACAAKARAQDLGSCTSSIRVLINQYNDTHIPAGSTIWFSSVLEDVRSDGQSLGAEPIRIDVKQSRITFGEWPYTIDMPDSTIVLDRSTDQPQRWWEDDSWSLTYKPSQIPEAFYDGMPFKAPQDFIPGYSGPITWSATFSASRPGVTVQWAWSAAVYSQFGVNGRLNVKMLDAPDPQTANNDYAGTPELYKQYLIPGAMGNGGTQYTGARSQTASVEACPVAGPPSAVPAHVRPPQFFRPPPFGAPWYRTFQVQAPAGPSVEPQSGTPEFSSDVAQRIDFAGGAVGRAVDDCYTGDLCALITYGSGGQLAIYSEGAATCKPYVLSFNRTNGDRTIYSFSRDMDHDPPFGWLGPRCGHTHATHIVMDGGRINLTVSPNDDATLRFEFDDAPISP